MKASFRLVVLVLGIAVVVFVVFVVFVAFVVFMAALLFCVNDPSAVFARHLTRGFFCVGLPCVGLACTDLPCIGLACAWLILRCFSLCYLILCEFAECKARKICAIFAWICVNLHKGNIHQLFQNCKSIFCVSNRHISNH